MKIIYEYHDVTKSDSLEDYTEKKLTKIFDRNEFVIRADVFFITENIIVDDEDMLKTEFFNFSHHVFNRSLT